MYRWPQHVPLREHSVSLLQRPTTQMYVGLFMFLFDFNQNFLCSTDFNENSQYKILSISVQQEPSSIATFWPVEECACWLCHVCV
jgi:hypothetical protein